MNDFGESLPTNKTATMSDLWRDIKKDSIQGKAESIVWSKSITGKRVDFPQDDGKLVWGIEIEIPLYYKDVEGLHREALKRFGQDGKTNLTDEEIQQMVERRKNSRFYRGSIDVKLPDNIRKIRLLDLSPQETLPKHLRTIQSESDFFHNVYLKLLTTQPSDSLLGQVRQAFEVLWHTTPAVIAPHSIDYQRSYALDHLFEDVLGGDKQTRKLFQSEISSSQASEILFIHAHGGNTNIIGEQADAEKGKTHEKQAPGNWIDLKHVIEKYNDPNKFAAILVSSCYLGNENPPAREEIPVFRPKTRGNKFTHLFFRRNRPVLASIPKKPV